MAKDVIITPADGDIQFSYSVFMKRMGHANNTWSQVDEHGLERNWQVGQPISEIMIGFYTYEV